MSTAAQLDLDRAARVLMQRRTRETLARFRRALIAAETATDADAEDPADTLYRAVWQAIDAFALVGVSINETAGTGRFWVNGAEDSTFASTYNTPSGSDASQRLAIGTSGLTLTGWPHQGIGLLGATTNFMTDAHWLALYNSVKSRFTLP